LCGIGRVAVRAREGSTYISTAVGETEMIGGVRPSSGLTDWRISPERRSIAVRPVDCAIHCDCWLRAWSIVVKKKP
jgi:hypothetical protein